MAHFKRLPLDGLVNARDLGGFPTRDGRVTRYGVFVRSEVPGRLTERDIRFLKDYGITLSMDLRSGQEARAVPSALASVEGIAYMHCPMMSGDAAAASPKGEEGPGRPPPGVDKRFFDIEWAPVYIQILENGRDWVRRALTAAAEWEGGIHYHCYTGKDRTGLFTALLLGLCGVDSRDIMCDYALSMTCLLPFYEKMDIGPIFTKEDGTPDYTRGFYRTDPQTMETVLRHLEESFGGVAGYVRGCGVSEETISRLRRKLTEEA